MLEALMASAVQGAASGIGNGLGKAMSGDSGPTNVGAPNYFDGSGWTVSTGGSRANGATRTDSALGAAALDNSALMWIGLAVVAVLVIKKMKGK
jgi:hypothetical protein